MSAISNDDEITQYLHCRKCLVEKPGGISPKDWQSIQVGWTEIGLQVWCKRHSCNIIHIDFQGQQHPANTLAKKNDFPG